MPMSVSPGWTMYINGEGADVGVAIGGATVVVGGDVAICAVGVGGRVSSSGV